MPAQDLRWWRMACDKNPDPIAFVSPENVFLYCNTSWCRLVGYSESELLGKSWMSITNKPDVGSDLAEAESIKSGDKDEYYIEKQYIHRDGTSIDILLYVHRCPSIGEQLGYIVFARKKYEHRDVMELKREFALLRDQVLNLEAQHTSYESLSKKLDACSRQIERETGENRRLIEALVTKGNVRMFAGNEVGGDQINGDKTGGNKNDSKIVLYSLLGFITFMTVAAITILGGKLMGTHGGSSVTIEGNQNGSQNQ